MKKITITIAIAMIAFVLIGCGSNSTSPSDPTSPFSLQRLGALQKPTSEIKVLPSMAEQVYDFELDTVATNASYYFIPNNSSTSAITGIKLKFDNPKFVVSPDTITTLSAPDKNTGVTPLIKVTVVHGKDALGVGNDDMLTADQYGTLTISGENADGKFSIDYTMHVYAKRMVITLKYTDLALHTVTANGIDTTVSEALVSAEFDDESNGCYVEVDTIVFTSQTRMITRSDLPDSLGLTEYHNVYSNKIIGLWSIVQQNKAIGSLFNNGLGVSSPLTNCPTFIISYDGRKRIIQ